MFNDVAKAKHSGELAHAGAEQNGIGRDCSSNVGVRAGELSFRGITALLLPFPDDGPPAHRISRSAARLVPRPEVLWHLDGIGPTPFRFSKLQTPLARHSIVGRHAGSSVKA